MSEKTVIVQYTEHELCVNSTIQLWCVMFALRFRQLHSR